MTDYHSFTEVALFADIIPLPYRQMDIYSEGKFCFFENIQRHNLFWLE